MRSVMLRSSDTSSMRPLQDSRASPNRRSARHRNARSSLLRILVETLG